MSLRGKVAIVTGGARGMGLSYAERLASLGAKIAVSDLHLDSAKAYAFEADRLVAGDLESTLKRYQTDVFLAQVDAADPDATQRFVHDTRSRWGRVDIVVCNAGGGSDTQGSFASQLSLDAIMTTFNRNLFSTMNTCRAVAPIMQEQKSGKIVNIASLAGIMAYGPGRAADYATAKAAVAHYTRVLAQEMAPYGVTVNAIAPGLIATGQWQARFGKNDAATLDNFAKSVPLGRLGTAGDCTNVVQFLTTSLSDYVTGQVIAVDGGISRAPC